MTKFILQSPYEILRLKGPSNLATELPGEEMETNNIILIGRL